MVILMVFDLVRQGGPVMWLLLGCSLAGIGLIIERAIFWFYERRRVDLAEVDEFFESIHKGQLQDARSFALQAESNVLNRLANRWSQKGPQGLIEAFDMAINRIEKRSQRYLYGLKTIVSISPLLGILGTVIGIIQSFQVMGAAGAAADPKAVGAGLAQALITTAFGLIIAVPCLIAHNYYLAKSRNYVSELDEYAEELVYHMSDNGEDPALDGTAEGKSASASHDGDHSKESVA
jgi:biopolymer transport protein ExbB